MIFYLCYFKVVTESQLSRVAPEDSEGQKFEDEGVLSHNKEHSDGEDDIEVRVLSSAYIHGHMHIHAYIHMLV